MLDDANRADNASLGANWTVDPFHEFDVPTVSPRIIGNAFGGHATNAYSLAWYNAQALPSDQEAWLTVTALPDVGGDRGPIVVARVRNPSAAADTGAGYMAFWSNTGAVTLYKYTAGNNTDVQIGQATGITLTVGHTLSLRCLGSRITVSTNGVTRVDLLDSSVVGGGFAGMGSVDDGAGRLLRWDGFGAGGIAPAGAGMGSTARALHRRRRR